MRIKQRINASLITCIIAVLLAGIFGGGSAWAEDASHQLPGTSQKGTLTIHKFRVEDYANLQEGTGSQGDQNSLPAGAKAWGEASFTVEKLVVPAGDVPTLTSPKDAAFTAVTKQTDGNGELSFPNLPEGFYLVTETAPSDHSLLNEQFLVKVPMNETDGAGNVTWNYDVHMYPKHMGEEPKITKQLDQERLVVGIDEEVKWQVDYPMGSDMKKDVPDGNGGTITAYATDFYIDDTMDQRLDYVSSTFTLADGSGAEVSGLTLVKGQLASGADYQEDYDSSAHVVTWSFSDDAVKKIVNHGVKHIYADIVTKVNLEAAKDSITPMWNNAKICFTNASGDPYELEVFDPEQGTDGENVPKVYVGSITIDKIQLDTPEKKLAGAVFKLAASQEDAKNEKYLSCSAYDEATQSAVEWEIEITTDEKGQAIIEGIGAGTYYLVETKAPEGYQRLSEPVEVTAKNSSNERFVTIQISNKLTKGPAEEEKPGAPGSSKRSGVKTGDLAKVGGLLLMLGVSGGVIISIKRRKEI